MEVQAAAEEDHSLQQSPLLSLSAAETAVAEVAVVVAVPSAAEESIVSEAIAPRGDEELE